MTNTNPRDLILKLTYLAEGVISKYLDVVGADPDALLISDLIAEARAYLDQPEPEGPTDEEIKDWHSRCADLTTLGEAEHYWAFDLHSDEVAGVVSAALARWGK